MPTRIDEHLIVADTHNDRRYTAQHVIDILESGPSGSARSTQAASYRTGSGRTVYYTALNTDLTILTARTNSGVTEASPGLYTYTQSVVGVLQFIAKWDDGDANNYVSEYVIVDK